MNLYCKNKYCLNLIILIFLTSLFFGNVFAQNQKKIDSLTQDLKMAIHDTTKVNDYNKLFLEYRDFDTLKAKQYVRIAISLAENINYKKGIATALFHTGILHADREDYKTGLNYYDRALKIRRELNDKKGIALCLNSIGNTNYFLGNYPEALKNYQEALVIREQIGPPKMIAYACTNIGEVYRQQSNYKKAVEYIKRALGILNEIGDKKGMANNYNNLGLICKEWTKYDEALDYLSQSLEYYIQQGDMKSIASSYNNIGIVYAEQGKPKLAIENYEKTLKISETMGDRNQTATTLINMAEAYTRLKEYLKALSYANQGLKISEEIGALPLVKSCYDNLFVISNSMGNTRNALTYYIKFSELKDSLFNSEKHKQVTEMEGKYQNEKKEKEIELKNSELEKKSVEIKQQKTQKFALIGGFALMIILAIVIFISYRRIRKANLLLSKHQIEIEYKSNELSQQNSEILAQRDEIQSQHTRISQIVFNITESINYAEKIQLALLPSDQIINEYFSDFFIFYKPKDIVSGDFYWIVKQNQNIYFTVADCTGHGVPGAFMSMLGISYLNEIIARNENILPGQVLNNLRTFFINAWQQNGASVSESGDTTMMEGMDIAFCSLNTETLEMQYAGANNPCWIIQFENEPMNQFENEKEKKKASGEQFSNLIELNGDKMPVGNHERMNDFVTQTIQLHKGDLLYLMSDGYKSQLGGAKGTKFLVKNLRKLICEISSKSITEQKNILEESLNRWRNHNAYSVEQTDDITVLAVRI